MKWTLTHIENLKKEKKIAGFETVQVKREAVTPKAIQTVEEVLTRLGIEYVTEHRFHKIRKFRFDIAVPKWMLAIEYEGLMSQKSRHTTITGFSKDCEKYNLAQLEGWKVLRYTATNYDQFEADILKYINEPK